jgi:outer membrane lipoprotein-sorting protein
MNGDDPAFNVLPNDQNLISQYLFLYSISGDPGDFDSYVDYNYRTAKMVILLKTGSNAYVKQLVDQLTAFTHTQFGQELTVSFGGDVAQTIALTDTMIHGKIMNIIQICLVIFAVSAIAFRSPLAGVIVLTPLLLAICTVFGVMGLAGIPLNIPNSLISAMAVGIGADYAIYLLYRMREQVEQGANAETAVRTTLATAGKACLFVATAVAGGYAVLMLSIGYNVHLWLALFIILAMLVSALASLTLIPGLVLSLRPAFIFDRASGKPVKALATASMLMLAVGAVTTVPNLARAEGLTPATIMEKSLSATKVRDSIADATFTLINKDGEERVRRTNGYTKLQDNGNDNMRTVRFLSPGDIKGTATLLIEHAAGEDDMWIYLPALKKVRRLVASNKKDSFVGTEFSYGDVIGHKTSDWTHRILQEETVEGSPTYVIESLPKDDEVKSNTGYSKRVSWVAKDNFIAVRTDFWDVGGQPLKTLTAREIKAVGTNAKWQPMISEAINLQNGRKTVIRFEEFKADQDLSDNYFTPRSLDR